MSSLTQTEFEDILDQANLMNQDEINELYNEINEDYEVQNYNYYRKFNSFDDIIEMITYLHLDENFIQERTNDLIAALERLINRREQINNNKCQGCGYCSTHNCLKIRCGCLCICNFDNDKIKVNKVGNNSEINPNPNFTQELVSEQNKIQKGKEKIENQASSSNSSRYDRLYGLELPIIMPEGKDIYDFTSEGILQLEICLIHYKTQIETSVMECIEKETNESQKEVWEQIYTMLQKV